jgi:septal ring factor EnvC (AmiA/AmiB activator)
MKHFRQILYPLGRRFCTLLIVGSLLGATLHIVPAKADTVDDLNRQKQALELKAQAAQLEANKQKSVAERAASQVAIITSQIGTLESNISQTESDMVATQKSIDDQNQQLANYEAQLRKIKDQQDALLREMYMMRTSTPDLLTFFANESVSTRELRQAQMSALKDSISALYARTNDAIEQVQQTKAALLDKSDQLERLKAQQDEQKSGLADYRYAQSLLKQNAIQAQLTLEAQANKARQDADKVEEQIRQELLKRVANSQGFFGKGPGVGVRVHRGDYVGIQGSTGFSTGDHVHFEVDLSGPANNWTSPWPYLNNGSVSWPLKSFIITQDYGVKNSWYACGYHMGIDVAGPVGSPVFAPGDGVVVLNEWFGGYGNAWVEKLDSGPFVLLGHLRTTK